MVTCDEKEGVKVREVKPLDRSPTHLLEVYAKLRGVRSCFSGSEGEFLTNPEIVIVEVDNVGIVAMDGLDRVENGGRVHVTFWDGRLRGREHLCRRIAEMWMDEYKLYYLYTDIPKEYRAVIAFCKRVGFLPFNEDEKFVSLVLGQKAYLHGANS